MKMYQTSCRSFHVDQTWKRTKSRGIYNDCLNAFTIIAVASKSSTPTRSTACLSDYGVIKPDFFFGTIDKDSFEQSGGRSGKGIGLGFLSFFLRTLEGISCISFFPFSRSL